MRQEERKLYNKGKNSRSARKNITGEQRIIKKIREDVRKEKKDREKQGLPKNIKDRWDKFITGKRLERKRQKKGKEHDKELRKIILPDNSFGD